MNASGDAFAVGEVGQWRVHAHAPFGLVVEAVERPGVEHGVVDLTHIPPAVRGRGQQDFPAIGSVVVATVLGRMPSGQLRLSMLEDDVAPGPPS